MGGTENEEVELKELNKMRRPKFMALSITHGRNFSKSDRYHVCLKIGDKTLTSGFSGKKKTNSPVWNHRFDVVLENEIPTSFRLIVQDFNKKEYGCFEKDFDLEDFKSESYTWGAITNGIESRGEIQMQMSLSDSFAEEGNWDSITSKREYMEAIGMLSVRIVSVKDLNVNGKKIKGKPIETQIVLKHGLSAFRTKAVQGKQPVFNQECRFWVKPGEEKYISSICLYMKTKDKFNLLGSGLINLGSVDNTEEGEYTFVVDLCRSGVNLTDAAQSELLRQMETGEPNTKRGEPLEISEIENPIDMEDCEESSINMQQPQNLLEPNESVSELSLNSTNSSSPLANNSKKRMSTRLSPRPGRVIEKMTPPASPMLVSKSQENLLDSIKFSDADELVLGESNNDSQCLGKLIVRVKFSPKDKVETWFYRRLLEEFDANEDGHLNTEEVRAMFSSVGNLTQTNVDDVVSKLENDSGEIEEEDLLSFLKSAAFYTHPLSYSLLAFLADGQEGLAAHINDTYTIAGTHVKMTKTGAGILSINDGYTTSTHSTFLKVMDRTTGLVIDEHIPKYIKMALNVLYAKRTGKKAVGKKAVQNILNSMSRREGSRMDDPRSVANIRPFIKLHKLDASEWLLPVDDKNENYTCFNHFFYRKLKPECRPIEQPDNNSVCVSCADCRMVVFEGVMEATNLWIKGSNFTIESLLTTEFSDIAPKFLGGSVVIARLAPQDYHRWHMPVSGKLGRRIVVDGALFTVNPIAVRQSINVYTENKRIIEEIHSDIFGLVLLVCIGATMVGSVNITAPPGGQMKKGDEHGFFAFGGSTVLVLFQPGKIKFDKDLVENSNKPLEMLVKVGMKIGQAI